MNTVQRVYSKFLYRNDKIVSTIIVNIIDICNYNCYYCYNHHPRTGKILDLDRLYDFVQWYVHNIKDNVNLCLLGGEPTLHPDLMNFCQKIHDNFQNVDCIVITNLSKDINYLNQLLDTGTSLIGSWHSIQNDRFNQSFIDKISLFDKKMIDDLRVKISVMYEKMNIEGSLHAFDTLYKKFSRNMEFSIVENNHLHGQQNEKYEYTEDELNEFLKRVTDKKYFASQDYKHMTFEYSDHSVDYVLSQTLLDRSLADFKNYRCDAGKIQLQIHFNGDIAPCDDLYEKGIVLGNIYSGDFVKTKFHFRICQLNNCPCPAFSMKEKI